MNLKTIPKPDSQAMAENRRGTRTFRAYAAYSMGIAQHDGSAGRGDRLLMNASARRAARASKIARQQFEPLNRPVREAPAGSQLDRMVRAMIGWSFEDQAPC